MDKVLVQVYVPVLGYSIDMFWPQDSPVYEVLDLVKRAVGEIAQGRFIGNDNTTLCYRDDGSIININLSVYELGIKNGSELMLI